jgi:hypothetical protein
MPAGHVDGPHLADMASRRSPQARDREPAEYPYRRQTRLLADSLWFVRAVQVIHLLVLVLLVVVVIEPGQ